jgi:hypothetical protein
VIEYIALWGIVVIGLMITNHPPYRALVELPVNMEVPHNAPDIVNSVAYNLAIQHYKNARGSVKTYKDPLTPGWFYTCKPVYKTGGGIIRQDTVIETKVKAWSYVYNLQYNDETTLVQLREDC